MTIETIREEIHAIMDEWEQKNIINESSLFVVGCSTSEVAGETIGTSGSLEIAKTIYEALDQFQQKTGVNYAFQCCEHLNRALVVEKSVALSRGWTIVSAIPTRDAGGSMATYAYDAMKEPVLVEHVQADVGMDIGQTFIGMHLKHVAVPLRFNQKKLGSAHVTYANTRPKLIGGERAFYRK